MVASYSRAPRWVRPVSAVSLVLADEALAAGPAGGLGTARGSEGLGTALGQAKSAALMASWPVPWWSPMVKVKVPSSLRTAV